MYEFIVQNTIKNKCPSIFLSKLKKNNEIQKIYEIYSLIGIPQNSDLHPEGDVFDHTLKVLDATLYFKNFLSDTFDKNSLILASICHDFGKPYATKFQNNKISAPNHAILGLRPTINFLKKAKCEEYINTVAYLVKEHSTILSLYRLKDNSSINSFESLKNIENINLLLLLQSADNAGKYNYSSYKFSIETLWAMEKLNINTLHK